MSAEAKVLHCSACVGIRIYICKRLLLSATKRRMSVGTVFNVGQINL